MPDSAARTMMVGNSAEVVDRMSHSISPWGTLFRDASEADVVVEAAFPGIVDGWTVYKLKWVDQGPVLPRLSGHCI